MLGIPTVKRDKQSYLLSTLDNLITNMDDDEANDTLIVVFIGETDLEYVTEIAKQIQSRFPEYIDNGLIEVISPPASYYPDWNKLRVTLNDPVERVKWRSKQNLDFSFLMAYSQIKATFYVQLEDDILAKRGYITIMKRFAVAKTAKQDQDPWFVLDFCQLGFIGEFYEPTFYSYLTPYILFFVKVTVLACSYLNIHTVSHSSCLHAQLNFIIHLPSGYLFFSLLFELYTTL